MNSDIWQWVEKIRVQSIDERFFVHSYMIFATLNWKIRKVNGSVIAKVEGKYSNFVFDQYVSLLSLHMKSGVVLTESDDMMDFFEQ